MKELIMVVVGVILMFSSGIYFAVKNDADRCANNWSKSGYSATYERGVCLVSIDGKRVPADNVRFSGDSYKK